MSNGIEYSDLDLIEHNGKRPQIPPEVSSHKISPSFGTQRAEDLVFGSVEKPQKLKARKVLKSKKPLNDGYPGFGDLAPDNI